MLSALRWARAGLVSSRPRHCRRPIGRSLASVPSKGTNYTKIQDVLDNYDNDFHPSYLEDDYGVNEAEADDFGKPSGSVFNKPRESLTYISRKSVSLPPKAKLEGPTEATPIITAPIVADAQPESEQKVPVYIGGYNLSFDSWVPDLDHDLLVEFASAGVRRLGLVQRPKGKRNWVVLDDTGDERKVNQYHIYFQFPRPAAWKEMPLEKLKEFRKKIYNWVESEMVDNISVVEHYKQWREKYGTREIIPYYDIARTLLPGRETYTPEQIYACHVFLTKNPSFFECTPRGFKCRPPVDVLFEQEKADVLEEERIARELFVAKLRYKLNQLKAQRQIEASQERTRVTSGKDAETLEIKPRDSESEAEFLSQAPSGEGLLEGIPDDLRDEAILKEWDEENDIQFLNLLKNYALNVDGHVDANVFAHFLYPLGYGDKPSDAFDLLTDLGFWDRFENPHLLRWQTTPLGFSPGDAMEAERLIQRPPPDLDADRRINFGDIPAFAIDPVDAHDADDAVSIYTDSKGDEWIYVHIADVARWVQPHSTLDSSARKRASSIYLPEAHYPMIPEELTQHMSLWSGKGPKYAMSFGVRLDDNGKVDRYRIVPSILNNVINMTYGELDAIISDDTKRQTKHAVGLKEKHYDLFLKLAEYAKRRRALRIDQGAVIVVTPQPEVRVKPNPATGTSVATFAVENDYTRNSKGIVMEMMLLVGEIAANYFHERGTPVLYRVQPLSSGYSRKSQHEIASEKTLILTKEQNRRANIIAQLDKAKLLGSAGIDTVPKKHYGYGLNMFVSITSPLRRYTDLLNLHQLKSALRREPSTPFTLVHQYEILPACQSKSEEIKALQRDSSRFWILGYLETQWQSDATRLYIATVLQPRSDSGYGQTRIFLPQFGIEADVQVDRPMMRGESIQVRVDFVNPFFDRLILKEAERRTHLF